MGISQIDKSTRRCVLVGAVLCLCAQMAWAQTEDPFSVRVESNLVLVHAEVYIKDQMDRLRESYERCRTANETMFNRLRASEPYLPKTCGPDVQGLEIRDFRLLEDGVEQKIQSVKEEQSAVVTVRDNLGTHNEWSETPGGRWSNVDLVPPPPITPGAGAHFYQIAYVPVNSEKGKCHQLRITVTRPQAIVYARGQYCYIEHPASDPLNGTSFGKQMENDLDSNGSAKIPLSFQATFFYSDGEKARIDIVLGFPWDHLKHEWAQLNLKATIGILGVAYEAHGGIAARFTDLGCCSFEKPSFLLSNNPDRYSHPRVYLSDPRNRFDSGLLPSHYETQFDLATGKEYDLRVVLSDGKNFGRATAHLKIDSYDGKQLAISSVALCKRFRDAGAAAKEAAAANLAPRYVPLVSRGMQVTPSAETTFKRDEPLFMYFEVYEPLLAQQAKVTVQTQTRIVDTKTGKLKVAFPPSDAAPYERSGSTIIPIGDELKFSELPKGNYRLEVQATDSAGRSTPWRTAEFKLE